MTNSPHEPHVSVDLEPIREPLEGNLKRATHAPAPLGYINSFIVWGASRIYRNRFGLGINEWRMLGKLSTFPGSTAADATADLGMNKATVSLSMTSLLAKGLITTEVSGRLRRMYLTTAGADMYQQMRPIAEERERIMLAPLSDEEASQFREFLVRIAAQAHALHEYDERLLAGPADDGEPSTQPQDAVGG